MPDWKQITEWGSPPSALMPKVVVILTLLVVVVILAATIDTPTTPDARTDGALDAQLDQRLAIARREHQLPARCRCDSLIPVVIAAALPAAVLALSSVVSAFRSSNRESPS